MSHPPAFEFDPMEFLHRRCGPGQISLDDGSGLCANCPSFEEDEKHAPAYSLAEMQNILDNSSPFSPYGSTPNEHRYAIETSIANEGKRYCGDLPYIKRATLFVQYYSKLTGHVYHGIKNPFRYKRLGRPGECFGIGVFIGRNTTDNSNQYHGNGGGGGGSGQHPPRPPQRQQQQQQQKNIDDDVPYSAYIPSAPPMPLVPIPPLPPPPPSAYAMSPVMDYSPPLDQFEVDEESEEEPEPESELFPGLERKFDDDNVIGAAFDDDDHVDIAAQSGHSYNLRPANRLRAPSRLDPSIDIRATGPLPPPRRTGIFRNVRNHILGYSNEYYSNRTEEQDSVHDDDYYDNFQL